LTPFLLRPFSGSVQSERKQIMKYETETVGSKKRSCYTRAPKYSIGVLICLAVMFCASGVARAQEQWPHVVPSKDGTPISYEVYGTGEPTLVFVHGWSCDARYWRAQVPHFSKNHRVVVLDLAGHGHSGLSRADYTMKTFGEDVEAVVEASDSRRVILIGHSMGGAVIAEAARLMPDRVIGLIGVDTLGNIEYPLNAEYMNEMMAPIKKDFVSGSRAFVSEMIYPKTDPALREWILGDMSSAPPAVALSAMHEYLSQYITGEAAGIFDEIRVPIIDVNGELEPIDYEANRRHMYSFDTIVIENADHFLMMDRPNEFNRALEKAIEMILQKRVK
jgi:pimeloyl-ACP methyl ester carboxylesterase